MTLVCTPSQTVGPFFSIGLSQFYASSTYEEGCEGQPVIISGRVFDGDDVPIPDALLEFWQADSRGIYVGVERDADQASDPRFRGFARIATDSQGGYALRTILPGQTSEPRHAVGAPHIAVLVFFRGILKHLLTRIYFEGEAANKQDPALQAVPHHRRHTLIAKPMEGQAGAYQWDIHTQGSEETVCFAL